MVSVPLPKKKLFTREELLAIVARIEKAKTVQYLDYDGKEKDIYVCRPEHGEIIEIVPRNLRDNRFEEGFAEIQSDILSFGLKTGTIKIGKESKRRSSRISNIRGTAMNTRCPTRITRACWAVFFPDLSFSWKPKTTDA